MKLTRFSEQCENRKKIKIKRQQSGRNVISTKTKIRLWIARKGSFVSPICCVLNWGPEAKQNLLAQMIRSNKAMMLVWLEKSHRFLNEWPHTFTSNRIHSLMFERGQKINENSVHMHSTSCILSSDNVSPWKHQF